MINDHNYDLLRAERIQKIPWTTKPSQNVFDIGGMGKKSGNKKKILLRLLSKKKNLA